MQAPAEATQEAEEENEGMVMMRRMHDLEDEIIRLEAENRRLKSGQSWGYHRRGNAYSRSLPPKPQVQAIDIAPEQSPHA